VSAKYIHLINDKDNVAVVIKDLPEGAKFDIFNESYIAKSFIPFGHKVAIANIKKGEDVIKYGEVIGMATEDINIGDHVHVHNVKGMRA
jgi:altronate dehydratase